MPKSKDTRLQLSKGVQKKYDEMITKNGNEAFDIYLKSIKYDYALIQLAEPIKRKKYPLLIPNFS